MDFDIEKEKIQIEKDGKIIDCDILFTFDSEDTLKSYVGYTDHSVDSNGRKNVIVSSYKLFGDKMELENVTDKKELDMINDVLEQIDDEE